MQFIFAICLFLIPFYSFANVIIKDAVVQSGYFVDESNSRDCIKLSADSIWDFCGCEADIHTPVIQKMSDFKDFNSKNVDKINAYLSDVAKKLKCEGKVNDRPKELSEKASSFIDLKFKVTFHDQHFISIVQDYHQQNAGAAHGMFGINSSIIDLDNDEILDNSMLFGRDEYNYNLLNDYIINELKNLDIDYIGYNSFFNPNRKRLVFIDKCDGCSFYINQESLLKISFNPYAIASFASGIVELTVPKKFVKNIPLSDILQE